MDWNAFRRPRRRAALVTLAMGALLTTAACGGNSGGGSGGGGIPSTIKVVGTEPLTGPAAFAGLAAQKGYNLAIKQINAQGFLGKGVKISASWQDTKGDAATAAGAISAAIADKSVVATFGSVSSQEAIAQSPLAQKAGLPVIYTQAGSDGVVIGDYTYRDTPLMSSYYPIIKQYLQQQGWKSIGIIYTNVAPTLTEVGTQTLPAVAKDLGMTVTKTVATTATTQDFSASIQQVLSTHPDGVAILEIGASNPTAMTQLRQAGYTGPVLGNSGAGAGNLKPAGADGSGMVWPVDFDATQNSPSSQKFVSDYTAEYGEAPLNYAAEAYDAAWFLARSIKDSGDASRTGIKTGMAEEAKKTTSGALGANLTWKDGTVQVPGVVVQWDGNAAKLLYAAS
jgi:branched-chain amino acid transport system substrate-binding protein